MTRSISLAATPARSIASRAARMAREVTPSPSPATRRSRTPVRDTIQSSVTPTRSAIGPFGTLRAGSAVPTLATAAPRSAPRSRAVAADEATAVSDMRRLDPAQRASDEAGQDLAGADLDEPAGARGGQRPEHEAPAHRHRERLGQAAGDVV